MPYWKPKIQGLEAKLAEEEGRTTYKWPPDEPTKDSWWQKALTGVEYAFYPFTATGIAMRGAGERIWGQLQAPWKGEYEPRTYEELGKPGWRRLKETLPGGELYEEHRQLPLWQQLLYEAPAWVGLGVAPTATALRAGLATKAGVPAKVARGALLPAEAIEQAPIKIAQKIFKRPAQLTNKLPHQIPQMTPTKARRQTKLVANELAEYLGKPPIKLPPKVITEETMKQSLWHRVGEKASGHVNRTFRVERLLLRADKFVEGGKMTQAFWMPIEKATNAKIMGKYLAVDTFRKIVKKNNIDLGKLFSTKVTVDGITLTPSERIGIYLHNLNADNIVHVVFGNNIPAVTMTKIANTLTPAERGIAEFLQKFAERQGPKLAEIMKSVTGKTMKPVRNYWPIQIQRKAMQELDFNQLLVDERKLRFASRWASSKIRKGFTLPRTGRAMQPVELDAFRIFMRHLDGVEHYKAFTPVIADLQRLLANAQFRNVFVNKEGRAVYEVLEKWVKQVAQTNPLAVDTYAEGVIRNLRINAVTAVLGTNITTALKQFPSYFSGMAEVGEMPVLRGLFTFLRHPKETIELTKKYAPQIYKRHFEREIAEAAAMKGARGALTGGLSTKQVFMFLTTTMDKLAVNSIWRGGFDDAIRQGMNPKQAAEYATRAIRKTQPYFSIKDVPEYWRSGEFMKALTIFTNQLNQYWNYYIFDIFGKLGAGKISKLNATRKLIETFVIPAYLIGWITRSRPAESVGEFARDIASMGTAVVPIVGNLFASSIRGFYQYGGLITTELFEQLYEFGYQANKGAWDKVLLQIPEIGGYVFGYPVAQPKRTIKAIIELAQDKSDDWMDLIWGSFTRRKAEGEEVLEYTPTSPTGEGKYKWPP